ALGILYPYMLYRAVKTRNLKVGDVLLALIGFCTVSLVLGLNLGGVILQRNEAQTIFIVFVFLTCLLALSSQLHLNMGFQIGTGICLLLCLFWWMPGIQGLVSWIYETSLGDMAHLYRGAGHMDLLQAIVSFFTSLGGLSLLVSAILILLEIVSIIKRKERNESILWFYLSLTMLLIPVIVIALSFGSDYRRAFIGFSVLFLILGILVLQPKYSRPRVRLLVLIGY